MSPALLPRITVIAALLVGTLAIATKIGNLGSPSKVPTGRSGRHIASSEISSATGQGDVGRSDQSTSTNSTRQLTHRELRGFPRVIRSSTYLQEHAYLLHHQGLDHKLRSIFFLSKKHEGHTAMVPNQTVVRGFNRVISQAEIVDVNVLKSRRYVVVTSRIRVDLLPGFGVVHVSLQDPNGKYKTFRHYVQAIGVSLYRDGQYGEKPIIFSKRGSPMLPVVPLNGSDAYGATVMAAVHNGWFYGQKDLLSRYNMTLTAGGINPNAEEILPLDPSSCSLVMDAGELDRVCSMAFGEGFQSFSIRVPAGRRFENKTEAIISWQGITGHVLRYWGIENVKSDIVAVLKISRTPLRNGADHSGIEKWKLGLIIGGAAVFLLLISTLLYACLKLKSSSGTK